MPKQLTKSNNASVRLGDLEIQVLEYLWQQGLTTVKQTHEHFAAQRDISPNTVQSTLERLHRKDLLSRHKVSHAYQYQPAVTREALLANLINEVLGRFGTDAPASTAAIIDAAEQIDEDALSRLEQEIKRRRKQKGRS